MLEDLYSIGNAVDCLMSYASSSVDITPVLLVSHPEQRARRMTELSGASIVVNPWPLAAHTYRCDFAATFTEMARELDETCQAIHHIEGRLQRLKRDVQYRRAAVINALSPSSAMPTEIARDIFMLATDRGRDDSLQTRLSISQTCQYWRIVSLSLPEFWQSIVLTSLQAPLFETLRLRSYPLPMWLRVEDSPRPLRDGLLGRPPGDENQDLTEPMTNVFAPPQASRLVSLRVEDCVRFPFVRFFGDSVLPVTMDELQIFASTQHAYQCAAMFTPRMIAARSILFNRAWIDPLHLDVTILVKLSLVDIPYEAMGRLLAVAADCPVLEILHLEAIRRKEPVGGAPVLILSPWLSVDIRSLAIVGCDEELWMQLLSLPTFRLPKLTSFVFHHTEEFAAVWGPTSEVFRAFVRACRILFVFLST